MKLLYAATLLLTALLSGNQALARPEDMFFAQKCNTFGRLRFKALQDTLNGAIFSQSCLCEVM
jgi:hypothetical protein